MIKFSKASKMPCRSWSLPAMKTCPGAKNRDGSTVAACKGCYALQGNYRFPTVKAPREHNMTDWKRSEWVEEMIAELDNDRYFRWFDSGDCYSEKLALKILQVMKATPWVKHWMPTRSYKVPKIAKVLEQMSKLHNVVIRYSSDSITGEIIEAKNSSTIIPEKADFDGWICPASKQDGKCLKCRACWDKKTRVVAYVGHGAAMTKNQKGVA